MKVLIDEVRKRKILWDRRNIKYKDKFESEYEWKKVAKKCRILKEVAKKKWRNLRDQFIKELKKVPIGTPTQKCAALYRGKWKYFPSLLFLRDSVTLKYEEERALIEQLMESPDSNEGGNKEIDYMSLYRDSPKINVLINEVRKRNFLWDKTNIRYKDKVAAEHEWNQVAKKCGLLKENTKRKWRNLRDQFSKELKGIPTEATGDAELCALNYRGKWQHFESLLFLRYKLSPLESEENESNMHETALMEELIEMPNSEEMENDEDNADETRTSSIRNRPTKKRSIDKKEKVLDIESNNNSKSWETEENENSLFLKSLLPYFEKLNTIQQLRVRSKFQNILIDEMQSSLRDN